MFSPWPEWLIWLGLVLLHQTGSILGPVWGLIPWRGRRAGGSRSIFPSHTDASLLSKKINFLILKRYRTFPSSHSILCLCPFPANILPPLTPLQGTPPTVNQGLPAGPSPPAFIRVSAMGGAGVLEALEELGSSVVGLAGCLPNITSSDSSITPSL